MKSLLAVGLIVAVLVAGCVQNAQNVPRTLSEQERIEAMGYNISSVNVFLNLIGATKTNFLDSNGLRKQYELYENGTMTDFIRSAEQKKAEQDMVNKASSSAMGGALVGGMIGGMLGSD